MVPKQSAVLVYKGRGVGPLSFRDTVMTLRRSLPPHYRVNSVTAAQVIDGDIFHDAALFVLPGGRDVPYHEDLSGHGNDNLRAFVEAGGGFLGICAGAYYGATTITFERGQPLEVTGERELGFFPGLAEGPVYGLGRFRYDTEEGAHPSLIRFGDVEFRAYYNGGCTFVNAEGIAPHVEVLGYYQDAADQPLPAIVGCRIGRGYVVLTGVHVDYRPESIKALVPAETYALLTAADDIRQIVVRQMLSRLGCEV